MKTAQALWVRLSIIFTMVILLGGALFWASTTIVIGSGIPKEVIIDGLRTPDGLVDRLQRYFAARQSWQGINTLLAETDRILPRLFTNPGIALLFTDAAGNVLYDGGLNAQILETVQPIDLEDGNHIAIVVNDVVRGYLIVENVPVQMGDETIPPFPLARWTNGLLVLLVIGGAFSVVAGIIASRQLTSPLSELAQTARRFGSRNMSARAAVRGASEIREVATAFNQMADELESAERLRRNMLADVAHELRTPLSVLSANLQALLDDVYPLDKSEIGVLANQVELLRRLVSDLHLLAQAEARQLTLNRQPIILQALVEQRVEQFNALAKAGALTLNTNLPETLITVQGDPDRLNQVLTNLIQNALTHTPDGGTVTVTLRADPGAAVLEVQDTGVGIPPEAQIHIFDRFFRADQSRDRATGGAGLGLAIVKAIVELHGGSISMSSVVNHGTIFTIRLPYGREHRPPPAGEDYAVNLTFQQTDSAAD
ncbi:MAG: ATP-binding protein [bacterium]|nr:ATP-binding protein [bacterium]